MHTFAYDRFGNLSSHKNPGGGSYSLEYDASGFCLTGIVDASGNRTTYTHDNNGRLICVLFPDGNVREHTYGCCAGISTKDEDGAVRKYVRDPRLLITDIIDGTGTSIRFTYDQLHRIRSVTDPLGSFIAIAISDRDGTIKVTGPVGNAVIKAFDSEGNLTSISDPEGVLFQHMYDPCGRRVGGVSAGYRWKDIHHPFGLRGHTELHVQS